MKMNNALTIDDLKELIAVDVRTLLKLPDNSHIDVKFTANGVKPESGGEINIKFSVPTSKPGAAKPLTGAQDSSKQNDDAVLIVSALRDANEKMKRPFLSLTWFRDKYLPALGINLTMGEWDELLRLLIARGDVILEKVRDRRSERTVTTIRTPDMPRPRDPKSE